MTEQSRQRGLELKLRYSLYQTDFRHYIIDLRNNVYFQGFGPCGMKSWTRIQDAKSFSSLKEARKELKK